MLLPNPAMLAPEPFRPQYHFTAPSGWLNDPNGLVYWKGEYHLFYQYSPVWSGESGEKWWSHAVSADLVHWRDLPDALAPDELGAMWSGSAVIDKQNSSGLGTKRNPPMVLVYTAAGGESAASRGKPFTQCLAWSTDGRTFTKYAGNPVLPHILGGNRDPKVVWHEESKRWVMALYLDAGLYRLFGSKDLLSWSPLSDVRMPGTDECPDFFPMTLAGKQRWVFWGANGNYQVGDFDGTTFHPSTSILRNNYGNTGYAAQTYSNVPGDRRVQIAWLNGSEFSGCPWNQQMSVPNVLSLRETPEGPRLAFWPVEGIQKLRRRAVENVGGKYEVPSGLVDLEGRWSLPPAGTLRIDVNGTTIEFDAAQNRLSALGKEATSVTERGLLELRILADRASLEIYSRHGLVWMPLYVAPKEHTARGVVIGYEGREWKGSVKVHELSGVWPETRTAPHPR